MRRATAILATISILAAACAGSSAPPDEERPSRAPEPATADTVALDPEPLRLDAPIRIEEPRRETIRDAEAWAALWSEATAGTDPPPAPPSVDFDTRMILLAAAGRKSTGGHAVSIESARVIGDTLHVDVVERAPGRGCMTTQAITYPVAAATVERLDAEATFHVREETRDC